MRQSHQRSGQKTQHMSPAAVAVEARFMLEQLSFPVDPRDTIKARRERAIRRSGLSPAKGMRLWYSQACSLLAHEFFALREAYKNHVRHQEARLSEELELLKTLRERGRQHELLDLQAYPSPLAAQENEESD